MILSMCHQRKAADTVQDDCSDAGHWGSATHLQHKWQTRRSSIHPCGRSHSAASLTVPIALLRA